jgi:hypothetical protein
MFSFRFGLAETSSHFNLRKTTENLAPKPYFPPACSNLRNVHSSRDPPMEFTIAFWLAAGAGRRFVFR